MDKKQARAKYEIRTRIATEQRDKEMKAAQKIIDNAYKMRGKAQDKWNKEYDKAYDEYWDRTHKGDKK